MKTFWRIIGLAQPIRLYAILFFFFSLFSTLSGVLNFTLLPPVLELLFNQGLDDIKLPVLPEFSLDTDYLIAWFNYQLIWYVKTYGKFDALLFLCFVLMASFLFKNLFYYLSMMMREILKVQVIGNAREKLYEKVTRLHLGYFSEQRKGDLMSRVTADVQEIEHTVVFSLDLILRDPITIIVYFGVLFSLSLEMTLFTFILVPLAGGMVALISRRLRKTARKAQASIGTLVSILEESLGALRIIKAYRAESYVRAKFNQENKRFINHVFSIARTRELASPFSEFAGVLIVVCILLYGGSLIFAENPSLNTKEFLLYVLILTQLLTPIKAISTAISYIQRGLVAGKRVFEILDTPVAIQDAPQAEVLPDFSEKIVFAKVSFRYGEPWVIKDLSFEILKGQKVALVGETGSGKTTIAELLSRFYEVEKGQILVDGKDLREIQLSSLMAQMGIVTQEAILFNDSIYNNIAFAHPEVSREEVERAAKVANAHDFIMKTEAGYETIVGDRGTKLSGGQRQRITIARAILKNPSILILDEATSALDAESEKLVQDAMNKLMANRTSLVIAHRLSTIQDADKIIVLKDGEVKEMGTHQKLLQLENGIYKKLSMMQNIP